MADLASEPLPERALNLQVAPGTTNPGAPASSHPMAAPVRVYVWGVLVEPGASWVLLGCTYPQAPLGWPPEVWVGTQESSKCLISFLLVSTTSPHIELSSQLESKCGQPPLLLEALGGVISRTFPVVRVTHVSCLRPLCL